MADTDREASDEHQNGIRDSVLLLRAGSEGVRQELELARAEAKKTKTVETVDSFLEGKKDGGLWKV